MVIKHLEQDLQVFGRQSANIIRHSFFYGGQFEPFSLHNFFLFYHL